MFTGRRRHLRSKAELFRPGIALFREFGGHADDFLPFGLDIAPPPGLRNGDCNPLRGAGNRERGGFAFEFPGLFCGVPKTAQGGFEDTIEPSPFRGEFPDAGSTAHEEAQRFHVPGIEVRAEVAEQALGEGAPLITLRNQPGTVVLRFAVAPETLAKIGYRFRFLFEGVFRAECGQFFLLFAEFSSGAVQILTGKTARGFGLLPALGKTGRGLPRRRVLPGGPGWLSVPPAGGARASLSPGGMWRGRDCPVARRASRSAPPHP